MLVWKHVEAHAMGLVNDWLMLVEIDKATGRHFTVAEIIFFFRLPKEKFNPNDAEIGFRPKAITLREVYRQINLAPGLTTDEKSAITSVGENLVRIFFSRKLDIALYRHFEDPIKGHELLKRSRKQKIFSQSSLERMYRKTIDQWNAMDSTLYEKEELRKRMEQFFQGEGEIILRN